jgi:hypothetical protein
MAHAAPTPPGARRRRQIIGAVLVVIGIAALAVAIVSLRNPKGRSTGDSTTIVHTITRTPGTTTPSANSPSASSTTSRPASSTPPRTSSTPPRSSPAKSTPAKPRATLYLLNNTTRSGLAEDTARAMRAKGWKVAGYETYSNDIISSCAYYDPSVSGAKAAAEELQKEFPGIKRVKARFPELPDYPIVVVLNSDYS